jgi:hypothetical protein
MTTIFLLSIFFVTMLMGLLMGVFNDIIERYIKIQRVRFGWKNKSKG